MLIMPPSFTVGVPVENATLFHLFEIAAKQDYTLPDGHLVVEIVIESLQVNGTNLPLSINRVLSIEHRSHYFEFKCATMFEGSPVEFTACINASTGNMVFETDYIGNHQLIAGISAYTAETTRPD